MRGSTEFERLQEVREPAHLFFLELSLYQLSLERHGLGSTHFQDISHDVFL